MGMEKQVSDEVGNAPRALAMGNFYATDQLRRMVDAINKPGKLVSEQEKFEEALRLLDARMTGVQSRLEV